ncbi:hypothetical protein HYV80_00530 [Candidatus Woesearchaeota archaeon]|nr:hypothetical protein [Candidatus Woesearchaeota archaeon]
MRGLVLFLMVLAVTAIVSFSFIAYSTGDESLEIRESPNQFEFSTFTSAVCEDKGSHVYCKDEYFVNCNGEISKAIDAAECNGMKVDVPKALGFAVFEKEWNDPRV